MCRFSSTSLLTPSVIHSILRANNIIPTEFHIPNEMTHGQKKPMIQQFAPRNYFIYLCEFKSTVERLSECVGPPQADKSDRHILKFISSKFIFPLRTSDCWWYVDVIASSLPRLFMQSMYHFSIDPGSRSSVPNDISSQKLY